MTLGYRDTYRLTGLIPAIPRTPLFIKDTFFTRNELFNEEKFLIEVEADGTRKLARPVHPRDLPTPRKRQPDKIREYAPAYFKEAFAIEPNQLKKRLRGEALGGTLTPDSRETIIYTEELAKQLATFDNRMEWMCCQLLLNGGYTLQSEYYPLATWDFERAGALEPTALSGTDRWWTGSAVGSSADPIEDIGALIDLVFATSRVRPDTIIMGTNALLGFRQSPAVQKFLNRDNRLVDGFTLNTMPAVYDGAYMYCTIPLNNQLVNVWVFSNTYEDDTGAVQPYWDENAIVAINSNLYGGSKAFGMIEHMDVLDAIPLYSYSKMDDDGMGLEVVTQSSPLIYPARINASAKWTVSAS